MRNRNMKNDKVVRAIALALSSVLASGAVMPAMTAYAAEQVTEEEAAVKETKEAAEAASDVVVEVPLGFINIDIPLEKDVEVKEEVAADIIEKTDKILDKVEDVIVIKLDKSVKDDNGQVADVENDDDDSLIDDSTINELNGAQAALTEGQDIIDAAIENANTAIEAGIKTSEEAQALKEDLVKAEADAEEQLAVAEAELNDAKAELADAQAAYDEAVNMSEEAKGIAEKKLAEAQALVASAEAKAAKINNTLIKIDNLLDNADSFLSSADKKIEDKIDEAQNNLDEAIKNLDESIENLEDTTADLGEKVDKLAEEIKDVKEATDAFVDSVKDAYYTQKQLDELYDEYAEAKGALESAEEQLKLAKEAYDNNGGEKAYKEALGNYETAKAEIGKIQAQYEDAKAFNENLTDQINAGLKNEPTRDLVERYIAGENQRVEIITNGEYGHYSDDGKNLSYVVVIDKVTGEVVDRYAYEKTDDDFIVKPLVTTDPDYYYSVDGGETSVNYNENNGMLDLGDNKVVNVKKSGDKYYYEGASATVEVIETLENITVQTISGRKFTFGAGQFNRSNPEFTIGIATYVVHEDGKIYGKYTNIEVTDLFTINRNTNKAITVEVGDNTYTGTGSASTGYTYKDASGKIVELVKTTNGYAVKEVISLTKVTVSDNEKNYVLSDTNLGSSSKAQKDFDDINASYNASYEEKNGKLEELKEIYLNKKATYDEYTARYNEREDALKEAKRTDLVVKKDIKIDYIIGTYENEIVYGDLAELPRGILDLISVDNVINMDPAEREEVLGALETIISSDNQTDKITALVTVVSKMGGTDADAYTALLVALGESGANDKLDEILDKLDDNLIGKKIADGIRKIVSAGEIATPFQEDYAKAWKAALDAKVDVVLTGIELAKEAGEAVNASIEVLKASAAEGAAITDVTIDALKVAVDGIVLGGLYTGDQVVKFADAIVKNLDAYVEELQKKTAVAAKEAAEAKDAVDKLKITAPGSQELAKALYALQQAEDKVTEFETALQKAKVDLETVKDKAAEAEEIRKKLADEEAKKNQPSAQTPANGDDNNNGGSSSNNREVAVISQGVAEQPTLATNPAGRTVRRSNGAAAPVEEVEAGEGEVEETAAPAVVEDNEVPMADKQSVTIDDNDTALSASIPVEDKMSWWWLILVIIAGSTGLEMYRRHQLKKKAAAEVNND